MESFYSRVFQGSGFNHLLRHCLIYNRKSGTCRILSDLLSHVLSNFRKITLAYPRKDRCTKRQRRTYSGRKLRTLMLFEKIPIADAQTLPYGIHLSASPADRGVVRGTQHLINAIFRGMAQVISSRSACSSARLSKDPTDA